ncbi:MAG TPA: ABC transporter substrate-binding protein [Chloroflexota bacterium]|nr:ABC transporter substrate-binding protein [Chloroflexota bacterium]
MAASPKAAASQASAAQPSASGSLTKITVASAAVTPGQAGVWLAKDAGIFAKNGLDVNITAIAGASTTVSALLAGDVQFLNAAVPEALSAIAGGTDIGFIGVLEPVYSFIFEVKPNIKTGADLKGKTLGVPAAGAAVDIATRVSLRKLGVQPDTDVKIIALGTQPATTAAAINGTVDGAVLPLQNALQAEASGMHPLLNLAEAKLPSGNSTVYAPRAYLNAHRDVAQAYIDSIVEGTVRLKHDKAFSLEVFKKYLKLDNDDKTVSPVYDFYAQQVLPDLPYVKPENFTDAVDVLSQKNPKIAQLDLNRYIDNSFVQSAADRHLNQAPA